MLHFKAGHQQKTSARSSEGQDRKPSHKGFHDAAQAGGAVNAEQPPN